MQKQPWQFDNIFPFGFKVLIVTIKLKSNNGETEVYTSSKRKHLKKS